MHVKGEISSYWRSWSIYLYKYHLATGPCHKFGMISTTYYAIQGLPASQAMMITGLIVFSIWWHWEVPSLVMSGCSVWTVWDSQMLASDTLVMQLYTLLQWILAAVHCSCILNGLDATLRIVGIDRGNSQLSAGVDGNEGYVSEWILSGRDVCLNTWEHRRQTQR